MNTIRHVEHPAFGGSKPGFAAQMTPMDIVFVEGLRAQTIIGIDPEELHAPQDLVIDVHAGVPVAKACSTDHIVDTIHYGVVRERILRLLQNHQIKLLEALAEVISDILIQEFGAHWVRVKVVKPQKYNDVHAVGVLIERTRPDTPPSGSVTPQVQNFLRLIGSGMVPNSH